MLIYWAILNTEYNTESQIKFVTIHSIILYAISMEEIVVIQILISVYVVNVIVYGKPQIIQL